MMNTISILCIYTYKSRDELGSKRYDVRQFLKMKQKFEC